MSQASVPDSLAFEAFRLGIDQSVVFDGPATDDETGRDCRLQVTVRSNPKRWLEWEADFADGRLWPDRKLSRFVLKGDDPYSGSIFEAPSRPGVGGISGWINGDMVVGSRDGRTEYVNLKWLNLSDEGYCGPIRMENSDGSWTSWSGRQLWTIGNWEMELQSRPDLSDVEQRLRETDGIAFTHEAVLRTVDGVSFDYSECKDALLAFQLSASFVLGRFTCPALGVGIDATGRRVWQEWSPRMVGPLNSTSSWWANARGDFGEPVRLMGESFLASARKTAVQHTVYSYLVASDSHFVEQRIAMAFSALERLSWQIYVIEGGVDAEKFDGKSAHQRLRKLLGLCQVPTSVPDHLPVLREFARDASKDVAWALAEVRNRIVHPKDPTDIYGRPGLIVETWQFLLYILDLVILRWINYRGVMRNRSVLGGWARKGDLVPWAAQE